jgi:hypothetical protein
MEFSVVTNVEMLEKTNEDDGRTVAVIICLQPTKLSSQYRLDFLTI